MFRFEDYKCAKYFVIKLAGIIALSFIKNNKKTSIKFLILVFLDIVYIKYYNLSDLIYFSFLPLL